MTLYSAVLFDVVVSPGTGCDVDLDGRRKTEQAVDVDVRERHRLRLDPR